MADIYDWRENGLFRVYDWEAALQPEKDVLNQQADQVLNKGRITRLLSWPTAAASGVGAGLLEHAHLVNFEPDITHIPQVLLALAPALTLGLGGLTLKAQGEALQEEARNLI